METMTEAECYKALGWAPEGELMKFILPLSNSDLTDYEIVECTKCPMRGYGRPPIQDCPCGGKNVHWEVQP
jgi:hypothetical protein